MRHPFRFLQESFRFFKTHRYHTIHSHIKQLNIVFFPLAKWFGVRKIISHAHFTQWSYKKLNGFRNHFMFQIVKPLIDCRIACSIAAGKTFFGKNFTVIKNGIEVEKFDYREETRIIQRKKLGFESNFIIGNIGRLNIQKNHIFLVEIFAALLKHDSNARLVLVGSGPLEKQIKKHIASKNLEKNVLLLSTCSCVDKLYQAFDVFCLPSLYEGLPVVGVEAQTAGLPCVFSDAITQEVLMLTTSCRLSLKKSAEDWAKTIYRFKNRERTSGARIVKEQGFDVRETSKQIYDLYMKLMEKGYA